MGPNATSFAKKGREMQDENRDTDYFDSSLTDFIYDPFDDGDEDIDGAEENCEVAPQAFDEAMLAHKPEPPRKQVDRRTPIQKMRDLLDSSNDQRSTLLSILDYCRELKPVYRVNERIDALRKTNPTVFSAANLSSLLERAGGLARVMENGRPYSEAGCNEGKVVEVDGVRYMEPTAAPQVYWLTTEAGLQTIDEDNPYQRLVDTLENDARAADLYLRVLLMSSREQGASAKDLSDVVDMDPLAQEPRTTAPKYSVALKKCGAIRFEGAWHITELGRRALHEIFGIEDDELAGEIASVEESAVPVPDVPAENDDYCYGD